MTTPSQTLRRITQELTSFQNDPIEGISAASDNTEDLYNWTAYVVGPPSSAYASQTFSLEITFPKTYPLIPFKLRFTSPIIHPNISPNDGEIALPELTSEEWSPVQTVPKILLCLQALLSSPDPFDNVLNPSAAELYIASHPSATAHLKARKELESTCATEKSPLRYVQAEVLEPTHVARKIGGRVYALAKDSPEFVEYEALSGEDERREFIVAHGEERWNAGGGEREGG